MCFVRGNVLRFLILSVFGNHPNTKVKINNEFLKIKNIKDIQKFVFLKLFSAVKCRRFIEFKFGWALNRKYLINNDAREEKLFLLLKILGDNLNILIKLLRKIFTPKISCQYEVTHLENDG